MIVLGIDPGFATVGFGVVHSIKDRQTALTWGAIITLPETPFELRLCEIYDNLMTIVEKYHPDCVAMEKLFFNTNRKTVIDVAEARGVLLFASAKCGLKVHEYTPLQVKQAVVGYGRAEKQQVMELVRLQLNLPKTPKPDDAADALAMALCHARCSSSAAYGLK